MKQEEEILILRRENKELRNENAALGKKVSELQSLIEGLQGRLNKDSKNSSKPPSVDVRRTKSLRTKSGKPKGGQKGHKGSTLQMSDRPDRIVEHQVTKCTCCGKDLSVYHTHRYERRQVFDIPQPRLIITEHRAEIKQCVHCQAENRASFPDQVPGGVQYGNNIKQLSVYLTQYQLLPYQRSAALIEDLTGHRISTGSLVNFTSQCSEQLTDFIEGLKKHLQQSKVVHSDETGFRYEDKRKWLHVATTEDSIPLTKYILSKLHQSISFALK